MEAEEKIVSYNYLHEILLTHNESITDEFW